MKISRLVLVLVVAVCALPGAAVPATASSAGLKVLVVGTCDTQALAQAIQSQPGVASATAYDDSTGTPTASVFAAKSIVIDTGDVCGSGYQDATTYGNRLADYVDHGGVVLQTAYDNFDYPGSYPTGRFASGGYPPLSLGAADNTLTKLGQVVKPNSPIVQGLGTFSTGSNTTTPLAAGATLLAKWADGRNAIAVKGRVVATSASAHDTSDLYDLARLALNTARYFRAVPGTTITKATIGASTGTAAFRFKAVGASTGFECMLLHGNRGTAKPCRSPKAYAHLKPGKYVFEVQAAGLGGPDPTPARKSFTITR